jgi:hypothetical protein
MNRRSDGYPARIVCLTEETTETLYLLGEGDRVVGISGYTVRPPEARSKPKVSAFINARYEKIEALRPDLILAFSDLQADLAAELIRRGYPVMTFNQRSVAEILQTIRIIGALVGRGDAADQLARSLDRGLDGWDIALSGAPRAGPGQEPDRPAGDRRRTRPGSGDRVVVWEGDEEKDDRRTSGMGRRERGTKRSRVRDQIDLHPAAGSRLADRRRAPASRTHRACGDT